MIVGKKTWVEPGVNQQAPALVLKSESAVVGVVKLVCDQWREKKHVMLCVGK